MMNELFLSGPEFVNICGLSNAIKRNGVIYSSGSQAGRGRAKQRPLQDLVTCLALSP